MIYCTTLKYITYCTTNFSSLNDRCGGGFGFFWTEKYKNQNLLNISPILVTELGLGQASIQCYVGNIMNFIPNEFKKYFRLELNIFLVLNMFCLLNVWVLLILRYNLSGFYKTLKRNNWCVFMVSQLQQHDSLGTH